MPFQPDQKTVQSLAVSLLGWSAGDLTLDRSGDVRCRYENGEMHGPKLARVISAPGPGFHLHLTPEGAEYILNNLNGCYTQHEKRVLEAVGSMNDEQWLKAFGQKPINA